MSVRNDLYNEIQRLVHGTTRFGDESELFIEIFRERRETDVCAPIQLS